MTPGPLPTLIEITRLARDQASSALADQHRSQDAAAERLATLLEYRESYGRKLQQALQAGVDAATLAGYQRFLKTLDDAVERARTAADEQHQRLAACHEHLRRHQYRLSSYDVLTARRAARERRTERRLEQRGSDEIASTAGTRKPLETK